MDRSLTETGSTRWGEAALILGGILMALGSVLSFVAVKLDLTGEGGGIQSTTIKGLDTDDGKFFLAFGVVLVLAATVLWVMKSRGWRVVLASVAILISVFMVYVGFSNITGLPDDAIQGLADQAASGVDREQVVAQLEEIVNADPGAGLYVGTAGAVLGLVGGILSLRPGPRPEAPSQLPPGWTPPDQGGKETPTEPRGEAEVPMEPWRRSEPVSPEREI